MATWKESTDKDMDYLLKNFNRDDVAAFRTAADFWADTIGKERSKVFTVGKYKVKVTAENHEIVALDVGFGE